MESRNDCNQPRVDSRIYLDHAATMAMLPQARAVMVQALENWANPSSVHSEGRAAHSRLEQARRQLLFALGQADARLVFTSGASEAIAIAMQRSQCDHLLVGATEHDAVLRQAPDAPRIPVQPSGIVDRASLADLLATTGPSTLVAVQHVNNETGVIQPVEDIAALCAAHGALLMVDAAQSAGKMPLPMADMLVVSAHKLGGAPGTGALILRDDRLIRATGGQERGLRGGTENLPAILSFAAAAETVGGVMADAAVLRDRLEQALIDSGGRIVAAEAPRVDWIVAIAMPGVPAATQLMHFDMHGIAVSAGAACSSGSMKASHVLRAMGMDARQAGEVIRISFGPGSSADDIDRFIAAWRALFARAGGAVQP